MAQEKIVSWPIKKLTVALYIFKIYLKVVYFFIKLFTKQKKQVFFLSRQYNYISFNYKEIIKSLERNNKDIKIIKRISTIRNKKILPLLNLYFDLKKTSFEKKHLKEINKKTSLCL